jgi:MFS family permease
LYIWTTRMDRTYSLRWRYLLLISLVAALGGLLFGYDWVVIGGAKPFFEKHFDLRSDALSGWANSCALVGCLLGALLSGGLTDRFGRKRLLMLAGVLFLATGIGTALADTFTWFVVFRLLGGVGIGLASNISPMYIAEVSPAAVRGKFVSLNQLTIVIGILAAQLANLGISWYGNAADKVEAASSRPDAAEASSYGDEKRELAALRSFVEKYGWKIEPEEIDDFFAAHGGTPATDAVVAFMKKKKDQKVDVVVPEESAVELARRGEVTWNERSGWRWMFFSGTLPAVLFFVCMFGVPESPRWLVKNGQHGRARAILARIGGDDYAADELRQIEGTLVDETQQVRFRELLDPRIGKILLLGVVLAVFQQWCGINVIFNYAEDIFREAGYKVSDIMLNIVITGTVNLLFTFVAIAVVDRLGRRWLMLAGAAGLAAVYALIGASFAAGSTGVVVVGLVLAAIACYACTLGPVTWVVLSEIYPNRIRGAAMSVSVFALWSACFVLTYTFPLLKAALGAAGTFWIYGAICVAGFLFIKAHLPETKGKSLEEIEGEMGEGGRGKKE